MDSNEEWKATVDNMKRKIPKLLFEIPLKNLSTLTKESLKYLDCNFSLPDDNGRFRDYRGLAVLQGYDMQGLNYLNEQKKYTSPTFLILEKMKEENKSIGDLFHCLQQLNRRDLLAKVKEGCIKDINNFMKTSNYEKEGNYNDEIYNEMITQKEIDEDEKSLEKLFTTDIMSKTNKKIEIYDVFICFDSESISDIKLMWTFSQILEENSITVARGPYSFLQGCYLQDAFAKAIYNRSKKVILLISKSFINSENCVMQLNFAKDSDKASWKNKVVPVYIENVKKPECIANINGFNYYSGYIREEFMRYFIESMKS